MEYYYLSTFIGACLLDEVKSSFNWIGFAACITHCRLSAMYDADSLDTRVTINYRSQSTEEIMRLHATLFVLRCLHQIPEKTSILEQLFGGIKFRCATIRHY